MNRTSGALLDDESAHIKQSIRDILMTAKGSRVMRRTYGSNLYQLIDRPISAGLALQISCACVMAITQWEPRVTVDSFKVTVDNNQKRALIGTLTATIKNSQTKLSLENIALKL